MKKGPTVAESRRERLRIATTAEIKALAWRQLEEGAAEINLHEIARQMGITPPALYRYFPNRQALTAALMHDSLEAYEQALASARNSRPETDPAARLRAVALAWRDWAVAHPAAFGLFTRRDLPGYGPADEPLSPLDDRIRRLFLDLLEAAWNAGCISVAPALAQLAPSHRKELKAAGIRLKTGLPPEVLHGGLHLWGLIHGLIATEISGRLAALLDHPAAIFEAQLITGLRLLGLEL